jgi:mannose-6-phosphate isomerase-like protein (cupin superfamily)
MDGDPQVAGAIVSISGRRLSLPAGPIFHLKKAETCAYKIGEFRSWAGYKNFDADEATNDLIHFQHVLSFAATESAGRTGIHAHLAHAHIVIPTSGRGVFSYDGVITEAVPGTVIVQHAGTVHDQFEYSYAAGSDADNRATPLSIEPASPDEPKRSFGFLELFVPRIFANVDIVPPRAVTPTDQATAWDHPYHAAGEHFHLQAAEAPEAAYRPVVLRDDLEVRDTGTWDATGQLVATLYIRPAAGPSSAGPAVSLEIAGESGGVVVLYMVGGSASLDKLDGETISLTAGDALTHSQGLVGDPFDCSPDMRLIRFFVSARAQTLRERTPDEIKRLEALGPRIITRREVRPQGDTRPINFLRETRA